MTGRWFVNVTDRRTYEIGLEISNSLKNIPENNDVRLRFGLRCKMYDIFHEFPWFSTVTHQQNERK